MSGWLLEEDLWDMTESDTKQAMVKELSKLLSPEEHSVPELAARNAQDGQGGLCGLAALYHSLTDTLVSPSSLVTMGYPDLRGTMASTLGLTTKLLSKVDDKQLVKDYTKRMFYLIH